ncbi:LOW QUALITY PROTEIN: otoancorin [Alosa sapidissima]|uniref:LOW QUALITY PROTEIN: otoancorin n=1 Tax=Alosa sapidissima TaxID=34773 RepID=UPI001C09B6C2|nr:LOW QUALITY PROTEIN: otoancorin [Alosa sapidissima]
MQTLRGKALVFLLLADLAIAVMSQEMMGNVMSEGNATMMGIPRMTPEFKEMAKKLMLKCSKMGHQPPAMPEPAYNSSVEEEEMMPQNPFSLFSSLLSSLSSSPPFPTLTSSRSASLSNSSVDRPDMEADWNVTEQLLNVTTLPEMIDIMKNSTEQPRCFMQTFISPVAWSAVIQNGQWVPIEDLSKLLWAAKPYLENMPPHYIHLPPSPDQLHMAEMMKMFSEVFSSLSEEQRDQIREWVKASVLENEFNCTHSSPAQRPKRPHPWSMGAKPTPGGPGALGALLHDPNSLLDSGGPNRVRCPQRQPWLNIKVLRIMGRFLSRLPPQEVKTIPSEELCQFFRSQSVSHSFQRVGAIKASLGRTLMSRLKTCFSSTQELLQHTASLGSLACFYDGGVSSLNKTMSKGLLSQLEECQNSASKKLKRQLVSKLFSSADAFPDPELLESLGSAVSALPLSRLTRFSAQALASTLPSLSRTPWSAAQAKNPGQGPAEDPGEISSSVLLSLGTVARGVASSELQTLPGEELLRGEERERLERVSQMMSTLQRKALLKGMRSSVNVSALVLSVPAPLLSSLSLSTLGRARLTSIEQLEGRKWTRAQSAFLLKKIVGRKLKHQHLRMLGQAIQGVTCEMIDSLIQNETMESVEALSQSSGWLDKTQIGCAARQLFHTLEQNRTDYFSSITKEELQSIPATVLIHLPAQRIQGLPVSVCGVFLDKMAAVSLSCLPHSSSSRSALTQRALDCLGKNLSEVSSEEVQSLGPLLCELPPPQLRSLAPEVLNSTLLELTACPYIPRSYRAQLFSMVTDTFGQPSDWSEEDMMSLRPFLLLDNSTLRTLPNRPWLRSSLSDLIDSLPALSSTVVPEEFRPRPDLSTLRWKLFVLTTREDGQSSTAGQRRRRREAVAVGSPTSDLIEELGGGNVFWSPAQLANMSCETFTASSSQLGEIRDFSDEQLAALHQKVIEALGPVGQLNESQVLELGCVSQGFSAQELRQLNISTLDTLELLSTCRWTQAQRRAVWQGFKERTGMCAAQLEELDIVGLGQFICGLEPEEIRQLSNDSFREAAEVVGYTPCDQPQLESFKRKAVLVFGEPQSWSEGQVTSLGNILAGLEAAELRSLTPSVFCFIKASAIPLIPPTHLAALSVSQLQALGPDNAAMVTEAQRAELGAEQRKGLADALGVAYIRAGEPSSGGSQSSPAPQTGGSTSHTMRGILLKPLLLLVLGLMLD